MILASRGMRNKPNTVPFFKYLERLEISPNIVSNYGVTPLHAIAYRGKEIEVFEYFLSNGVDVNQEDEKGTIPLMNAAWINDLTIVKLLSKHTKDVNHQNKEGKTALSFAVQRNSFDVIDYLIKQGASTSVKDSKGNNLFYYLIKSLRPEKIGAFEKKASLLISKGLSVTHPQSNGNSLYHLAVETNNTNLIKWVNSKKVEINKKNNDGMTPLHIAIRTAKNDTIIQLLLNLGADKTIKTVFGESTLELAMENEVLKENYTDLSFLK
jgi:ankyrin repeat protein